MILGARRSRVVAGIWALVGLGFLAAGVILWVDARRVSFELPAALLAFVLATAWWRQRAVLDRHGINTVHAFRERRLLWAGIERVVVDRPGWFRPALVLEPKGGRAPISVPASAGLNRRQRNRLLELLTDLSHQHGFELVILVDGRDVGPVEADPVVAAPAGAYRTPPPRADSAGPTPMFDGPDQLDDQPDEQPDEQPDDEPDDGGGVGETPDRDPDRSEDPSTVSDPAWLAVLEPPSADGRADRDDPARF